MYNNVNKLTTQKIRECINCPFADQCPSACRWGYFCPKDKQTREEDRNYRLAINEGFKRTFFSYNRN